MTARAHNADASASTVTALRPSPGLTSISGTATEHAPGAGAALRLGVYAICAHPVVIPQLTGLTAVTPSSGERDPAGSPTLAL